MNLHPNSSDPLLSGIPGGKGPDTSGIFARRGAPTRRPTKIAAKEEPDEDLEPESEPVEEEAPVAEVRLSNPRWDAEEGVFNSTRKSLVDVALPAGSEHLTRVNFILWALVPDGEPERIDAKEGTIKDGVAEVEFTLWYPQARDEEGNLLATCPYVFAAKHRDSKEEKGPELEVVEGMILHYQIDVDCEQNRNDELILEALDGSWKHSLLVGDLKEVSEDWVELVFPKIPRDKSFKLVQDPKDGEEPFVVFEELAYKALSKRTA